MSMDAQGKPAPRIIERAAALLIGNELLSGKVREENLGALARTLRALGVRLERVVMILDEREVIAREVRALSEDYDVVFTSGGVGPTHDDVTVAAVAQAFEWPLVQNPRLEALLRRFHGAGCTAQHLRMARVPSGACLTEGNDTWPAIVAKNVWVLPGLPEVFLEKMVVVRAHLRGPAPFRTRSVLLKTEEPELVTLLDGVVECHPLVEIGSYPKWSDPEYRTRVTFDARDEAAVEAALAQFLSAVPPDAVVRVE